MHAKSRPADQEIPPQNSTERIGWERVYEGGRLEVAVSWVGWEEGKERASEVFFGRRRESDGMGLAKRSVAGLRKRAS